MTPQERTQAGRAEASGLEPGHIGYGDPLPDAGHHLSLEEYEARARAGMDENIRQGMSRELAEAEYEADMYAETYADRWQAQAEAEWQAAIDAGQAGSAFAPGSGDPAPEPELEW
jgi:hypothetical protein